MQTALKNSQGTLFSDARGLFETGLGLPSTVVLN